MPRSRTPNEVSSGGVVLREGDSGLEVCLVNDGRYWGLPKGNVERGETPEMAALREIEEEVGLPRESLRIVATLQPSDYVYRRPGRLIFKRVHQFLVSAPAEAPLVPDAAEIIDARWMTPEEARELASFTDTRRAIDEALAIAEATPPGT